MEKPLAQQVGQQAGPADRIDLFGFFLVAITFRSRRPASRPSPWSAAGPTCTSTSPPIPRARSILKSSPQSRDTSSTWSGNSPRLRNPPAACFPTRRGYFTDTTDLPDPASDGDTDIKVMAPQEKIHGRTADLQILDLHLIDKFRQDGMAEHNLMLEAIIESPRQACSTMKADPAARLAWLQATGYRVSP